MKARTRISVVIALLTASHGLLAQRDRLAADSPLPTHETVAAAEAEGAAFPLPRSGEWLLIATAGDDWGCFVLTT